MTKSRGINAPKKFWTPQETALLWVLYPCTYTATLARLFNCELQQVYRHVARLGLKKSKWYLDSFMAQHLRADSSIGIPYRYPKGHVPANKGKKCANHPNMVPTQFKPGQKPLNHRAVGSVRPDTDGYLLIKMAEGKYQWRFLHRVIYQRMHGKIPVGHVVILVDGNKLNCSIANLTTITKAQNCLRNSIHNYGVEIAEIYRLKGKITRQINKRESAQNA